MYDVLVLLGAGASKDCDSDGATCNDDWRPPLTRELFNMRDNKAFEEVLLKYRGAQFLAAGLAEKGNDSTFSLEEELRRLAQHENPETVRNFQDIPCYLSELFWKISDKFTSLPGGYCRLVQELIAEHQHKVLFISLNYDNLLEQALEKYDPSLKIESMDDYCDRRLFTLVKPHGSINWWLRFHANDAKIVPLSRLSSDTYFDAEQYERAREKVIGGENFLVYPKITVPMASKGSDEFTCPRLHIDFVKNHGYAVNKLLFIGTSCLDHDVLSLVDESVKHAGLLHVVVYDDKDEVEKRLNRFNFMRKSSLQKKILEGGFKEYLRSRDFDDFLKA